MTTALPTIPSKLHSSTGYAWISSYCLLSTASTSPIWAELSDIWGRKPLLLLAISIFFLGNLMYGVSVSMDMLISAGTMQGIGIFGVARRERPLYFGIIGMTWALASAIGPFLGKVLNSQASWKWCFSINLHAPKAPMIAGLKAVDWLGSVTIITGAVFLLLALQMGGAIGPYIAFVLIQWKDRGNAAVLVVGVLGASPLMSGVYLLPLALSLSATSSGIGFVVRGTGRYLTAMEVATLLMAIGFGLFISPGPTFDWPKIILYQIIAGLGIGPNFQYTASATSTTNFLRTMFTSLVVVMRQYHLRATLGLETASLLTGENTTSSINLVDDLPILSSMWIFVAFGGLAFVASLFAPSVVLKRERKLTETGLEAAGKKRVGEAPRASSKEG
ncbi:MFS general substrate transporter [Acephala macrosclerotiorum]|nr:MFS general substrate transporter [Acephala macrosclerotiorum]